jgi:hypothetical protein
MWLVSFAPTGSREAERPGRCQASLSIAGTGPELSVVRAWGLLPERCNR